MLLKLLSAFPIYDSKRIFFKVLTALRSLKPEINRFFNDIFSDDPDEGPSLSSEAINLMFRFYEEEYHFPSGILSCEKLSDLPRLVDQMVDGAPRQIRGWIICNDQEDFDHHVVPVFAVNYNNKTHIFIFDSLGHIIGDDSEGPYFSCSWHSLINHLRQRECLRDRVAVYSYKIKRQNSEIGCATFSLLDLKNLCERHFSGAENIVDFFASQDPGFQPRPLSGDLKIEPALPIYEIQTLPPEMMKVTQSLRKISAYRQSPPILHSSPEFLRSTCNGDIYRKSQDLDALHRRITEIERIDPKGSSVNLYVDQKRFADVVYLISHYFNYADDGRVSVARKLESDFFSPVSPAPGSPFQ
jgi:hypothetical protein